MTLSFDMNATTIRRGSVDRKAFADLARSLKSDSIGTIVIEGHACAHGGRKANLAISRKRAFAVRDKLVRNGVPAGKIVVRYFGADRLLHAEIPTRDNFDDPLVRENRRVTISVIYR